MKILPCDEIGSPTTCVSQPLRFREVCLFPPQLLRQQLLLGDVHRGAAVSLKHSIFYDWNADAPDVSNLAIGTNYPVRDIAAAVLLMQLLHCCCQRGLVLGIVGFAAGRRASTARSKCQSSACTVRRRTVRTNGADRRS